MRDTVRMGRIGGVSVGLNWSLFVMVALLTYGLAENRFPIDAPGYSGITYVIVGGATALALIVGVLAHELGHAVVAGRVRLHVDGITLSWLGGATLIEGDAAGPGAEFSVAAVGPAVSLAVGGLLWTVRLAGLHLGFNALALSAVGWLAVINIALAIFNLLPTTPLDGGRMAHAIAWRLCRDRSRATVITSAVGLVLGASLAGVGAFLVLLRADTAQGVLLFVFGLWFYAAARAERQAAILHQTLGGRLVSEVMRPVGVAPAWITVDAFFEQVTGDRRGWAWLLERSPASSGVGRDALDALAPRQRSSVRLGDVAVPTEDLAGAAPQDDLLGVLLRSGGRHVILVVANGRTIGAVLPGDVDHWIRSGALRPLARPAPKATQPSGAGSFPRS